MLNNQKKVKMSKEILFASGNINKIKEIQAMLGDLYCVKGLKDIGFTEEIEENAPTLEGNASIKSKYLFEKLGCDCFSDDTGLEVEILDNEPGVRSARYAGEGKNSEDNMDLLLKKLEGATNRNAQFRTVISLILDGKEYFFEGIVEGTINTERRGAEGFGYDPIFTPKGFGRTFAEMSSEEKNSMSHRGRAVEKLVNFLKNIEK